MDSIPLDDMDPSSSRKITGSLENQDLKDEKDVVDVEYPTGFKLTAIMVALCLTVFCVALDNTVSPIDCCISILGFDSAPRSNTVNPDHRNGHSKDHR